MLNSLAEKVLLTLLYFIAVLYSNSHLYAQDLVKVLDSGKDGPTLCIFGMESKYGNSGSEVVGQLQWIQPKKGMIVLIRHQPWFESSKVIPQASGWKKSTIHYRPESIHSRWKPDLLIVLRESYDHYSIANGAEGGLIVGDDRIAQLIESSLAKLNGNLKRDWKSKSATQSAKTVTVITSSKNARKVQRPSIRQYFHRRAVMAVLRERGMIDSDNRAFIFPAKQKNLRRIAVYDDAGAVSSSGHDPIWLLRELRMNSNHIVELVNREDILNGELDRADAVVFGGGLSNKMGKHLKAEGRKAIREFVENGGGYLGICAGAFLASQPKKSYEYLGLLKMKTSGNSGTVKTPLVWSKSPLGSARTNPAKFSGGPKIKLLGDSIQVWATFKENPVIGKKALELKDSPAVVSGYYGKGRVLCFGPHCERRPSHPSVFLNAVKWVSGGVGNSK